MQFTRCISFCFCKDLFKTKVNGGGDACVAFGCNTNYETCTEKLSVFTFPEKEKFPDLHEKWVEFVNRGAGWKPKNRSVLCIKHFDSKFITFGKERNVLKRKMEPIPTIHSAEALKTPSAVRTPTEPRRPPKVRLYQLSSFKENDSITSFDNLNASFSPPGYEFKKTEDSVIYYKLEFDSVTSFPKVFGSIRIDRDRHVQLQCNGNPFPLPLWFTIGTDAKLNSHGQILNFATYFLITSIY